ncbi:MAG: methyltransferase domain-containing protein [Agitococcus sp.]
MSDNQYFGKDLEAMTFAINYHQWILEQIQPFIGKSVAEIGAGNGNFSEFILQKDINKLYAFEPSKNMFDMLKSKYIGNQKIEAINDFFENKSNNYAEFFDSVMYINVLEHIPDDLEALMHAHTTIKKEGYLLIFVPALGFLYSDLDKKVGHQRRYSKKMLIDVVTQAGFKIEKVKYFDVLGILPWYITFVLLGKTTSKANVTLYDKIVVPIAKIIEKIITPPLGKNLILIAKKL